MFVWIFLLSRDAGSGMMYPIIYMGMALAAGLAWYWFALAIGSLGVASACWRCSRSCPSTGWTGST